MAKPGLDSQTIPAPLLDYLGDEIDLRWVLVSKDKLPAWFTMTKAKRIRHYRAVELFALLKAKQERRLVLTFDITPDQLWQTQADALNAIGIQDLPDAEQRWAALETICLRQLLHDAKVANEQQLVDSAISEFRQLMTPPISVPGNLVVIEPGLKSGLKLAACDEQGNIICHSILFPHEPQNQWTQSIRKLDSFVSTNRIKGLVMATGEGYRESRRFIKQWLSQRTDQMPCYSIRGIGLGRLSASDEEANVDNLYLKVDAIARLAIDPVNSLSRLSLKSLLTNPLLSVVNQARLSRELAAEWLQLAEKLTKSSLPVDPLFSTTSTSFDDLKEGLKTTGKIINQTDYGYFVDIGIVENGLLHNSKITPGKAPETGQFLEVTVINVNTEKQQFSLGNKASPGRRKKPLKKAKSREPANSAMADALKAAMTKKH